MANDPDSLGIPGLTGIEHIGLTVPDLDQATQFFVEVIGCQLVFEIGPFQSEDNWMQEHLNVPPRTVLQRVRMLRCGHGPSIELFEYLPTTQASLLPNHVAGGHHLAFYVEDMDQAVAHLHRHGLTVLGNPTSMTDGPSAGLTWVYFLAPWGLQLELVSYPNGMAHGQTGHPLWRPRP